jgi:hypothetical protein
MAERPGDYEQEKAERMEYEMAESEKGIADAEAQAQAEAAPPQPDKDIEEHFTKEEKADIKEIALFLRKFKDDWDDLTIIGWAIDEFLRRRYIRAKDNSTDKLRLTPEEVKATG